MVTKKDLNKALERQIKSFTDALAKQQKFLKDEIENAIAQIMESISKVVATKDDIKEVTTRLDTLESDMRDVKRDVGDIKADFITGKDYQNHEKRIKKLETAVFPS